MAPSIPTFMQAMADAFMKGDHEWLTAFYVFPLAIFLDGDILIEKSEKDALNSLLLRRGAVLNTGATQIKAIVLDSGEPATGRFPVRVDWHFLNAKGSEVAVNELRYFCRMSESEDLKIEIIEFLSRGMETSGSSSTDLSTKH